MFVSVQSAILYTHLHINLCEMLTCVVALKAWGTKIVINCDYLVTVRVINTGASRNTVLQSSWREVCFIATINSFDIKVRHISGSENRIPDLLSRWNLHGDFRQQFLDRTRNKVICRDRIPLFLIFVSVIIGKFTFQYICFIVDLCFRFSRSSSGNVPHQDVDLCDRNFE